MLTAEARAGCGIEVRESIEGRRAVWLPLDTGVFAPYNVCYQGRRERRMYQSML